MSAVQTHMPSKNKSVSTAQTDQRLPIQLPGRFLDSKGEEHRIVSVAMSSQSAQIRANDLPQQGSQIVCYFDGLGRVTGEVTRVLNRGFLVQFSLTTRKRDKLADQLIWLINKDPLGLSDERQHPRYKAGGPAQLKLDSGGVLNCRVVDISLTGAGFEALSRAPAIGEIVSTGNLRGKVVRSDGRSFGIRFMREAEAK